MGSTAIEFGVVNALHTGHVLTDTAVSVAVPLTIQRVQRHASGEGARKAMANARRAMLELFTGRPTSEHCVERTERFGVYGAIKDDIEPDHDIWLQRALAHMLASRVDFRDKRFARIELVESAQDGEATHSEHELMILDVGTLPPIDRWVAVAPGIEVLLESRRRRSASSPDFEDIITSFRFRSFEPDGSQRIGQLIRQAYQDFLDLEAANNGEDGKRYLYRRLHAPGSSMSSNHAPVTHKRYPLSNDKTFDSLFFEGKPALLRLIHDFQARSGKFAMRGFPYKLGLLLHGAMGTGKTSIIKAIAALTGRHIVTMSLSKVKTNYELMQQLFNLQYQVDGVDSPVRLAFDKVVFVIEDLDAVPKIVQKRGATTTHKTRGTSPSADNNARLVQALLQSKLINKAAATKKPTTDRLTLAGLLNALDGVVDCPGRILIMVTKDPSKLDPALVRPGRVNKILSLSHMTKPDMQAMLEHYYEAPLTATEASALHRCTRQYSPAAMEAACMNHRTAKELLKELEAQNTEDAVPVC